MRSGGYFCEKHRQNAAVVISAENDRPMEKTGRVRREKPAKASGKKSSTPLSFDGRLLYPETKPQALHP